MKITTIKIGAIVSIALSTVIIFSACNSGKESNSEQKTIIGAGSSFDNPLFSKMFAAYNDSTKVRVNYQSVGSGAGISQLTHKTVDFGASDAPMNEGQSKEASAEVLHIPVTAGAVVVSYNLPDFKDSLKFTPDVLSKIFLGEITKWNDPQIAAINAGVQLPAKAIVVAHRSDGSGTSAIFTSYLSKVSSDWQTKVGSGTSVKWPVGLGGKGNEGVAGLVKQTPGGIGYIELAYAIQNQMRYVSLQNKAGNFIVPSIASVTAAANITIPQDGKVLLTNTEAADGYPISGFSWVLIYKEQGYDKHTQLEATDLVTLVSWMINSGQQYSAALDYAPLSPAAQKVGIELLKTATFKGQPIMK